MKTVNSRRKIPLLGVSLDAMSSFPEGFPRYADSPGLSALVNRHMRSQGLAETPSHTLYSLRHSFEDRMLEAGVDERIRRDVLGHALDRERYGKGASLKQLAEVLGPVAL